MGGRVFAGLGLQGHPDGSSVSNIFEDLCTEEGTEAVKNIFEGWFKFSASNKRRKLGSTYSEVHREEDRSAYPSTK